jgi:putative ABC transport system permease protein
MIVPSGPRQGERAPMLVLGVRPDFNAFKDPEITQNQPLLTVSGTVLFDRGSRFDYTALKASVVRDERPTVELGGKTATIEGLFHIGSSFGNEGNIVTSEESFFLYALNRTSSAPNVGLIRVAAGQDPAEVAGRISAAIAGFDDTQALTLQQYVDHSQRSLARNSPINYIFSFGAFMGLIVGTVVVVQILSADVQDHLPEYATFKAIGFTNRYLLGVIAEQSMVLTVAGFVPGFLVSLGCYELVRRAITMPIAMPFGRVAFVFGLIAAMCIVSGAIAMQRVRRADPAEVF